MRIDKLLAASERPAFSFEFFPPRTADGERDLRTALAALAELEPDFASVTCGAGGSTRERTLETTGWLRDELEIETLTHLTCTGASTESLRSILDELADAGVENVLALRGDPPAGGARAQAWSPHPCGLRHASELIELIEQEYDVAIAAACFPEGHPESVGRGDDLRHLQAKVDAGASFLITQLFFENDAYFEFVDAARAAGIDVPIVPGVMPITSTAQIQTVTTICGASIPPALARQLQLRADDPAAVAELGVAHATLQCAELLAGGAPGIHFYTLNRAPATRAVLSALKLQRPWERVSARVTRSPMRVSR